MSNQIIIENFQKAVVRLKEALEMPKDDIVRDASMQRFEYTYEMAWKLVKRVLKEVYNIDEEIFLEMLKQAQKVGLIENAIFWFNIRKARNYTSHNYSEFAANFSYQKAIEFLPELDSLISKLEQINKTLS